MERSNESMGKVLIFFTEAFEEVEALTVVDLLRRAGIDIQMVSVTGNEWVTGSHHITVKTEALFEDVVWEGVDMIVLPGGPGVDGLIKHEGLVNKVKEFNARGKMLAAICAAPRLLGLNEALKDKSATCYPGLEADLLHAEWKEEPVVCSNNVITSRGLGTSIDFALAIIRHFMGPEKAEQIGKAIIYT